MPRRLAQLPDALRDPLRNAYRRVRFAREALLQPPLDWAGVPLTPEQAALAKPVFVLSTGRSGTAWLVEAMAKSRHVHIVHEPVPRLWRQAMRAYHAGPQHAEQFVEIVRAARDDRIAAAVRDDRHYIETNNRLSFLVYAINLAYPGSRFIHLYRHPADFVRSAMRRNYYRNDPFDFVRVTPQGDATWQQYSRFEKACWLWQETNGYIARFLSTIAPDRQLSLKSEAMWQQPAQLVTVAQFIGADDLDADHFTRTQKKKVNIQKDGEFRSYDDWSDAQIETLRTFCPFAREVGYRL